MKILITGGLGYIGSHTVTRLVDQGYEPIIVDNLDNSSRLVLDALNYITGRALTFYEGDVRDRAFIEGIIDKEPGLKGVIHFAAHKAVNESMNDPLKYYNNNVGGLISLCEALQEKQITNFVFSSSCTVYGETKVSPVSEETPRQTASSPYGHTKLLGEDILKSLADLGKMRVLALRYFNPIGVHPSALIGELPSGIPQNLVPYVTQTAIGKRTTLKIFGNDYPTEDGTAVRDFIHVMDLADAHIKALQHLMDDQSIKYDTFNIGTGKGTSVLKLIQEFERVTQVELPYVFADRRPGDITAIYADAQKANKQLGWKPQYSLGEALKSAWRWEQHLDNFEKKQVKSEVAIFQI
jgi:UDP-glucose 4-epimerase